MVKRGVFSELSSSKRLFLFLITIFGSLLLVMALGFGVGYLIFGDDINMLASGIDFSSGRQMRVLKYLQMVNQVGLFIMPPLLFALLISSTPMAYLRIKRSHCWYTLATAGVLIIVAIPFVNWLIAINQQVVFPEWLSSVEQWMRRSEADAEQLTRAFLNVHSLKGLMVNIVMIGILPAVGEELLFRGVLLKLFSDIFRNTHGAIWFVAVLFSALHMQFFGFFPRMMLGLLFGYLLVWTDSLWVPIFAHFVNNTFAVIISYFSVRGDITTAVEDIGSFESGYAVLGSVLLIAGLLAGIYYHEKHKRAVLV